MAQSKNVQQRPMGGPGGRGPGGPGRGMPGAKPKDIKGSIKRLMGYMGAYKWYLLLVVALIAISSLAQVKGTSYLQGIVDDYLTPLASNFASTGLVDEALLSGFVKTLVSMAFVYLFGALSTFLYARLMLKISTGTLLKLRTDLFEHMETLPIRYFDTHAHGDIMSRYTNDVDTIREMMSNSVASFISSGITVVSIFIMMVYYSWLLTLVVIAMMVLVTFVSGKIAGLSGKYFRKQQTALGALNGYIEEMIEGAKVVKVFCREQKTEEKFNELNENMCEAATAANTFGGIMGPVNNNLSHALYAIVAVIGCVMVINGFTGLTLGTLIAFLQYTRSFSMPVSQISQQFNTVLNALAGAERVFALIDEPSEQDEGYVTLANVKYDAQGRVAESDKVTGQWAWKHPHTDGSGTDYKPVHGDVVFEDVTFGYVPDKVVLRDVSLHALPGQKIALVGSTGAGKTTITNLINRFYDVPGGKIRYDGININKIRKTDLRRSLSMVLQDTHLFTGTIMENIRYGKLDATDEEVRAAAKLANADGFISRLPDGYNTMLTQDGANLSQGQRQLLAIARAAVANPPVLILDEATSSIDTRTEQLVERGMNQLMEGRTVFVIAHRLSTVRNSDMILVLEHGQVIERGKHDELLEQKGRYYQLYTGMQELS